MDTTYSNVTFDVVTCKIDGEEKWKHFPPHLFSATLTLFSIRLCMDIKPETLGEFMEIADGYGAAGFFPGGYDWSGIRDSSPQAVLDMFHLAQSRLADSAEQLKRAGLPDHLVYAICTNNQQKIDFDEFLRSNWTPGVPEECTNLNREDFDCLEQNRPEAVYCASCTEYARICESFEKENK